MAANIRVFGCAHFVHVSLLHKAVTFGGRNKRCRTTVNDDDWDHVQQAYRRCGKEAHNTTYNSTHPRHPRLLFANDAAQPRFLSFLWSLPDSVSAASNFHPPLLRDRRHTDNILEVVTSISLLVPLLYVLLFFFSWFCFCFFYWTKTQEFVTPCLAYDIF